MQYRRDERAGRDLPTLGFGCMRLPKYDDSEALILRALELGITYFDTAYAYLGNEEMLGKIIKKHDLRDRMLIATKLPQSKCHKAADIDRYFNTSLERLQTDHVEYYLVHNLVTFEQWQRLLDWGIEGWIGRQRAAGRIGQIGFSFHGAFPEFKKIVESYDWDFVQIQYNYVNEHYQAGRDGLDLAAQRGLPVIIMEPLLGGKLATGLPKDAESALKAADPAASCASWGLRWLWDQPAVTCVLSGMGTLEQLEDNCRMASESLPGCLDDRGRAAIAKAKDAFSASFKVPCTGCNYCMPCPRGISIPASFAAYNESYALSWFTGVFHYMISSGIEGENPRFVSACTECGACSRQCPQHIDIPAELKKVRKRLEPRGVKPAVKIYRKINDKI